MILLCRYAWDVCFGKIKQSFVRNVLKHYKLNQRFGPCNKVLHFSVTWKLQCQEFNINLWLKYMNLSMSIKKVNTMSTDIYMQTLKNPAFNGIKEFQFSDFQFSFSFRYNLSNCFLFLFFIIFYCLFLYYLLLSVILSVWITVIKKRKLKE